MPDAWPQRRMNSYHHSLGRADGAATIFIFVAS